jgi:hypothetical protein
MPRKYNQKLGTAILKREMERREVPRPGDRWTVRENQGCTDAKYLKTKGCAEIYSN